MTGFHVDTDGIRTHAQHVGTIGAGVQQAVEAAHSTQIGDHSFGILCGWLAPCFHSMEAQAETAFSTVGTNLSTAQSSLTEMASEYDAHDAASANTFEALNEGGH